MHNRRPDTIPSREIGLRDGLVLAPLVLCIVGLALYPQLILHRTDPAVQRSVAATKGAPASNAQLASTGRRGDGRRTKRPVGGDGAMTFHAPDMDYAALSPLIALTAGVCFVLLLPRPRARSRFEPHSDSNLDRAHVVDPGDGRGAPDLALERPGRTRRRGAAARRPGDLDLADRDHRRGLRRPALDPRAGRRAGGRRRVPRAAARLGARDDAAGAGAEPGHLLRRDRDPLDPPLHPLRDQPAARAVARVGAQVPDRRLARLGDAALRHGLPLRRLGLDRLRRHRRRHRPRRAAQRPAGPRRHRHGRGRARLQDLDRALPPVDAGRLRGSADADHLVHGGGDQGGRLRRLRPLLRRRARPGGGRLAAGAGGARRGDDRDRQRRRAAARTR